MFDFDGDGGFGAMDAILLGTFIAGYADSVAQENSLRCESSYEAAEEEAPRAYCKKKYRKEDSYDYDSYHDFDDYEDYEDDDEYEDEDEDDDDSVDDIFKNKFDVFAYPHAIDAESLTLKSAFRFRTLKDALEECEGGVSVDLCNNGYNAAWRKAAKSDRAKIKLKRKSCLSNAKHAIEVFTNRTHAGYISDYYSPLLAALMDAGVPVTVEDYQIEEDPNWKIYNRPRVKVTLSLKVDKEFPAE